MICKVHPCPAQFDDNGEFYYSYHLLGEHIPQEVSQIRPASCKICPRGKSGSYNTTSNFKQHLIPNTFQLVVHGQHQHRPLLDPYLRTSPSSKLLHSHDRVCRTEWNLLKASHDDELEIRWVRRVCEDLSSTLSHSTALQFISGLIEIFNSARLQGLFALTTVHSRAQSILAAPCSGTLTSKSSSRLSVEKIRSESMSSRSTGGEGQAGRG